MALQSTESYPAIDRTQPLPLAPELADCNPEAQDEASSDDGDHHTVYVAFDASIASAPAMPPDSVAALLGPDPGSTVVRKPPAAAASVTTDPTELVQIQALELAATRAEVARQEREHDELQRAIRLRDGWLADLRKEMKAAQDERRHLAAQLAEARRTAEDMTKRAEEMSKRIEQQAAQIASLEAQAAERMSATVFASDSPRTRPARSPEPARSSEPLNVDNPATLLPLDDSSPPIVLNRKVMTVGRTRESDVCVPSVLVSRDHARMLVSEESVVLFDVGSINGSFVNEELVKRHTLRDGDIVRFADRRYRYCG
jgi:hypothetical protein